VQGMADPPPDGRVDVVAVQVVWRDPGGLVRFGVGGQLAADRLAVEAHVDRDPDLAVAVGDAMPGITEYPDQPGQFDRQAGLFPAFPDGARGEGLFLLQRAGRDGPVGPTYLDVIEKHPCGAVAARSSAVEWRRVLRELG